MNIFLTDELNRKGNRKPKKWVGALFLLILCCSFIMMAGTTFYNMYSQGHPIDKKCLVESAEVSNKSSGTGGIATSSTELKINTADCGTVYVDHAEAPKKSYQDMADELNQHQGQKVTLIFPPFQLPAQGDYALGYGYRL